MKLVDMAAATGLTAGLFLVITGALCALADAGKTNHPGALWRLAAVTGSISAALGIVAIWLGAASGWGER